MTGRFSQDEQAEMTALLRKTNHRAAIVQRGLDDGLTFQQIADRDGVSLARVRDYSTWERVLAGRVPNSIHDAYYCNVYVGYIWGLSMSEGLRHKLKAYRQELAQLDPGIDPNSVTPDKSLPGHSDRKKEKDYGQLCPKCFQQHRGECLW
jgi:hypothetical protein